jgi:surface protein
MFYDAYDFNQDLSSWDVSKVTKMQYMFTGNSYFNQDISGWNVSSVTNMESMLSGADVFDQNLGSWDVSNVVTMQNMLSGITLSTAHYDSLLTGWAARTLQHGVTFDAGDSTYTVDAIHLQIITDFGWTISDGGSIA